MVLGEMRCAELRSLLITDRPKPCSDLHTVKAPDSKLRVQHHAYCSADFLASWFPHVYHSVSPHEFQPVRPFFSRHAQSLSHTRHNPRIETRPVQSMKTWHNTTISTPPPPWNFRLPLLARRKQKPSTDIVGLDQRHIIPQAEETIVTWP